MTPVPVTWELGTDEGVATFYPYLADLPITQILFLVGLTAALLGILGLPTGSCGPMLRRSATAITIIGLLLAGIATVLAGTGRLDQHGMIAVPALHRAASDRPVRYTPVCRTCHRGHRHRRQSRAGAGRGHLRTAERLRPGNRSRGGCGGAPVRHAAAGRTTRLAGRACS